MTTGQPKNEFVDVAVRHVRLKQGVIGIKIKIMRDLSYKEDKVRPDWVQIRDSKREEEIIT